MKFDRGIIKWQPFESLESSQQIIQSLMQEKKKIKKPLLSEEEIMALEEKIIAAFYTQEKVQITFYQNGTMKKITSQIIKIDQIYKLVYLQNKQKLLFQQIINITDN